MFCESDDFSWHTLTDLSISAVPIFKQNLEKLWACEKNVRIYNYEFVLWSFRSN